MRGLLHEVGGSLDVLEAHILGAGDVDEHTARAVDGGLHERACDGHAGSFLRLALAGGVADAHVGKAGVLHDGGDVRKVEVDEAGVLDEIGDAGDGLMQHVVRDLEGVGQRDLLVGGILQAVVRDDEQRIDLAEQLVDAGDSLVHAALALELEGLGHHGDREDSGLAGDIGNGGSSAGAGAAAHAGRDEDHVGILKGLGNVVAALLGGALADLGIAAGALTVGQLLADLDLLIRAGNGQRLLIGIDGDVLDTLGTGLHHAIDNVVAGAADADDLQGDDILGSGFSQIGHCWFLPVWIGFVCFSKNGLGLRDRFLRGLLADRSFLRDQIQLDILLHFRLCRNGFQHFGLLHSGLLQRRLLRRRRLPGGVRSGPVAVLFLILTHFISFSLQGQYFYLGSAEPDAMHILTAYFPPAIDESS